jgi:hypothetical protein
VAKIFSQMNNGGVAVAGELGWTTGDFGSTLTLGAGPRYVMGLANSSVRPYVHVLVGLARYNFEFEDSANNFFVGPGGGVVFPLNDRVSAFGQVDIMIIRGDFEDSGQRFTFGVALDVGQ